MKICNILFVFVLQGLETLETTSFAVFDNKALSTMTKCKKVKVNVIYLPEDGHMVSRNI